MRHLDRRNRQLAADRLERALEAVRDDDAHSRPPLQLHERVMQGWDSRSQGRAMRRPVPLWCAAAATLILALTWASTTRRHTPVVDSDLKGTADVLREPDAFLGPEVLMDDASSVQYVRLSLAPRTMAAFGIPVADPSDERPIAVEALVGIDGIPRAIRYAQVREY
jgi:hypothetical protein